MAVCGADDVPPFVERHMMPTMGGLRRSVSIMMLLRALVQESASPGTPNISIKPVLLPRKRYRFRKTAVMKEARGFAAKLLVNSTQWFTMSSL